VPRGRGAGVIKSSDSSALTEPLLLDAGDLRVAGAPVGLRRMIRGLPDLAATGEVAPLFSTGARAGGLRRAQGLRSNCVVALLPVPLRLDGEDPSMTDASSPSIAFASALNFIGGTGTSSSELSPIANFHCWGNGASGARDMAESGELRLGRGLGS
jgi:hypothetical protein